MLRTTLSAIPWSRITTSVNSLKKTLFEAGVPRIEIERDATKIRIHIHCSRPGIVIGKGGAEIEKLKAQVEKMVNKGKTEKLNVFINVVEVKQPDKMPSWSLKTSPHSWSTVSPSAAL